MKIEKATKDRITRNVILSLFIYVLPIALMFATFLITGERPWLKKPAAGEKVNRSLTIKNNGSNGGND